MKRLSSKFKLDLNSQIVAWNTNHDIGTNVIVKRDNGSEMETRTRSRAAVLSGHSAVIWLDGISGCYLLERVRAIVKC